MSPFYLNCTRLLFCLTLNTARVFGILLSLSILLPWSVFSHLLPMWLPTLGPLSLLLWSSRFSGPRSVNAATFKNSAYVAEFSVVFPSFPRLFFPLSTRPLSSHKNSFPLYHSFVRTHHHKSSFKHSVVSIWNKVPNDIINPLISTSSFKRSLWQYLTNTA